MFSFTDLVYTWKQKSMRIPDMDVVDQAYDDAESSASDTERFLPSEKYESAWTVASGHRKMKWLTIINLVVFFASLTVLISTAAIHLEHMGDRNYYLKKVTAYSPMFDKIYVPVETKKMDATLMVPNPAPIFRQPPSPEVDAAWDRLANVRPIPITREDVIRMGKDPEQAAKFPQSFGFGSDAYIGRLDIFHIIHCLDQIRREANFDYYYGKHWGNPSNVSEMHKTHTSHCFHIILQNLMCSPNLDIYTHFWADAQLNAFPDFNVNHKCFDFEKLLSWQETNSVSVDEFAAIRRPESYKAHIMAPKFKELFGYEGPGQFEGEEVG